MITEEPNLDPHTTVDLMDVKSPELVNCPVSLSEWSNRQEASVEIWDSHGYCVFVNEGWRKLWQMPDHVLVGSRYKITADVEGIQSKPVWQVLRLAFSGADSIATETPPSFYDPHDEDGRDGRPRWSEGFIVPLWTGADEVDSEGPAYTAILLNDVTEFAFARQRLRASAAQIQNAFSNNLKDARKRLAAQKKRQRMTASLPPEMAVRCAPAPDAAKISTEQARLLALLAKGYTIKEASSVLVKSEKTLYVQLNQAAVKLGLHSIAQLTIYACRWFGPIP
jgi:hypothetical protein